MNWLDIAIIVVIGIFTFLGLRRGLIKSILPLLGLILAIFLAGKLYAPLAERLSFIDSSSLARIVAFLIIFAVVMIVVSIIAWVLRALVQMSMLGWADRLGGAFFGLVTGWIICSMVVVLLARYVALPVELPELSASGLSNWLDNWRGLETIRQSVTNVISDSRLANLQIDTFPVILNLLPDEFDVVRNFFEG